MSTTELEVGTTEFVQEDGIEDIPDMVGHIYLIGWSSALCGISCEDDPHDKWHHANSDRWMATPGGTLSCPGCGVPLCTTCVQKNNGRGE